MVQQPLLYASVAQLVEQRTENPRVVGSIPTGGTNADLAHLVERRLAKAKVAGSSPVIRSIKNKGHHMVSFVFYCADLRRRRPEQTKGLQRASMRQHTWMFVAMQQTVSSQP